jgi:hypothetical protein
MSLKELNKWSNIHEEFVKISEFLDWLNSKGILLCEKYKDHDSYIPIPKNHHELLIEYYDIDEARLERERREILVGYQPIKEREKE